MSDASRSPGSNPHADRPNWRPAETIDDYLDNCREGLEDYSDGRAAKLLGWTLVQVWRAQLMPEIPEELLERLFKAGRPTSKAFANVALALRGDGRGADLETRPTVARFYAFELECVVILRTL